MKLTLLALFFSPMTFAASPSATGLVTAAATVWQQPCHNLEDDSVTAQITIQGSQWSIHNVGYEEDTCATAYFTYDQTFTADISGENLNLQTKHATMTALSQSVADALNSVGHCDIKNWKAGVAVDVTGKMCGEFQVPAKNEVVYSLVKQSPTSLQIGIADDTHDGTSEAKRYSTLDASVFSPAAPAPTK